MSELYGNATWNPGDPARRRFDAGPPEGVDEGRADNLNIFDLNEEMGFGEVPSSPDDVWEGPDDQDLTSEFLAYNPHYNTGDGKALRDGSLSFGEVAALPVRGRATYEGFATDDQELISKARYMTAQYYLKRGFITHDMLDEEGRIAEEHDPYLSNSRYFVFVNTETGELVACCRKIYYDPEKGERSFPLLDHQNELNSEQLDQLSEVGLENVVELSALVKNPRLDTDGQAVFKLYRTLVQDAWGADRNGREETFIMACNPKLYKRLRLAFDGIIQRLGPDLDYPGQKAVPAMFSTRQGALEYIAKSSNMLNPRAFFYRRVLKFMLATAKPSEMDADIVQALHENGYTSYMRKVRDGEPVVEASPVLASDTGNPEKKISRKPEIIAAAGLLGYTALRTVAVAKGVSPDTDVDWRIFLGIEVATTWPYAKGMGTLIRAAHDPEQFTARQRRTAGVVASSSFLAPYAYVIAEGEGLSPGIWTGVAAFAAVGIYSAAKRLKRARQQTAELAGPEAPSESE